MSRSHKKFFCCKDKERNPFMKRYANRCVRRALNNDFDLELQHNSYRKFYDSWEISDYRFQSTWKEYWESTVRTYEQFCALFPNHNYEFPDKEKLYREWRKFYYNK